MTQSYFSVSPNGEVFVVLPEFTSKCTVPVKFLISRRKAINGDRIRVSIWIWKLGLISKVMSFRITVPWGKAISLSTRST